MRNILWTGATHAFSTIALVASATLISISPSSTYMHNYSAFVRWSVGWGCKGDEKIDRQKQVENTIIPDRPPSSNSNGEQSYGGAAKQGKQLNS